jgi:hypothetical protein
MFTTSNLALATAIQAISDSKLKFIQPTKNNKFFFVFDPSEDPYLEEIIANYWAKKLPIDALTYFETLRNMKSRLYEKPY